MGNLGKFATIMGMCVTFVLLASFAGAVNIPQVKPGEDVGAYILRVKGAWNNETYARILGAANAFKEGDEGLGVAADNDRTRENARKLLANTKISLIHDNIVFADGVQKMIWETIDVAQYEKIKNWTFGELKQFLLTKPEADIKSIMYGLDSDAIACVVKLMSNEELIAVGAKVFNNLPGSKLGAKGYLGARIQPNSPTDSPLDIKWQVLNGWSFAVGDLILGTNPVDGTARSTLAVEEQLKDMLVTFGLENYMPWCVLSHIDTQAEVEEQNPGSTAIWFQSLAGTESANAGFDLTLDKLVKHAKARKGKYGLYFETGQGADYTNGHGHGFDMVMHESRKYGVARALSQYVAAAQENGEGAWVHLNDVAGFIGPEVFKTREQLVRCCLEDIVMGKLHGLVLGLDICSTLHMPVSLDDLEWCQDQIAPANPAYLMALPTRNDPMLSYLTTQYQDHVRLREKFGFKVQDPIWDFFKKIQIIDENGKPTKHFGDPKWVYYQFMLAKGDTRTQEEIFAEAQSELDQVASHGVDIAFGYGENIWDLNPELNKAVHAKYDDAKISLWAEMTDEFVKSIPNVVAIKTTAQDREDYIAAPPKGEVLSKEAVATLAKLRKSRGNDVPDVQFVISDGLNTKAIMDEGHLAPYLEGMRAELTKAGYTVAQENILITGGRVRAGYKVGEELFGDQQTNKPLVIIHIIGERPGSGHHAFSAYVTKVDPKVWGKKGTVDHDQVKLVAGISDTGVTPPNAIRETMSLLKGM